MPKKKSVGEAVVKTDVPAARKPQAAAKATAPAAVKTSLIIDYPLEREIVASPVYTFRLSALEPRSVEVSLDGSEWRPCRESVGYWWYDWSGYQGGTYTLEARMTDRNGKTVKSKPRQFTALI
jgi:hypothetical protein